MLRSALRRFSVLAVSIVLVASSARPLTAQTGSVQGRVTDTTGAVIVGAVLTIDGTGIRAISSGNGRFTLGGVPAGSRTLRARVLGFAPESLTVAVTAGQTTAADVRLTRSAYQLAPVAVVTGSRARHTAAEELAVPVDVFTSEDLKVTGTTETTQIVIL